MTIVALKFERGIMIYFAVKQKLKMKSNNLK